MPQLLMLLPDNQLDQLGASEPETGMSFQILDTPNGLVSVFEHGPALPLYDHQLFYDVYDLLAGLAIPVNQEIVRQTVNSVHASRHSALVALRALSIAPSFTGAAGAFPLIASATLAIPTVFFRRIGGPIDRRYVGGSLTAGTYLTAALDHAYANSGFAAVGRYALPMPIPASTVIEYELPAGAVISIGTVAPAFGQAGGGVEVQLPSSQVARRISSYVLPDY